MTKASPAILVGDAGAAGGSFPRLGSGPRRRRLPLGIAVRTRSLGGGLPRGRPNLVAGAAGCAKTLLGVEFLVRGAMEFGEPGVPVGLLPRPQADGPG